jgi:ATP adenylyltransferase
VQLVPLPLGQSAAGHSLPIQPLVEAALASARPAPGAVFSARELPFRNYLITMEDPTPDQLARSHGQLRALALADCPSYNLLLTRAWMMALPRRQESGLGLPLNALSFAGTMLVRSAADLVAVRANPMAALAEAGFPW